MAQTDYMKRDDEGRAQQFIGFRDNIPAHLSTLGLLATDPDLVQQAVDATRFRAVVAFLRHHAGRGPRLDRREKPGTRRPQQRGRQPGRAGPAR